jgi:hypothetical protein
MHPTSDRPRQWAALEVNRMRTNRSRNLVPLLALFVFAMSATGVMASSPHVVDPDSVSPTLNPHYAPYDCWAVGDGSICQGEVQASYGPEVFDGFHCDGAVIYVSGRERQHITRWHDADGNATKTILDTEVVDVFSLDPAMGDPSVTLRGRFTKHYEYLVPGVRDSRVMRQTGASLVAKSSDGGVLAHETGWIEFAPGLEEEVWTDYRGPKDLLEDFDGFLSEVCGALAGG